MMGRLRLRRLRWMEIKIDIMVEGVKETAEESLKINREFESIEEDFDWEWKI